MLELRLFGPAEVRVEGASVPTPPPKELALLAYLALHGSAVPRSSLQALLWPQSDGGGGLRVALSRLRGLPGSEDWLEARGQLVSVRAACDVARFETALAEGDGRTALAVWPSDRGLLLAGLEVRRAEPFQEWLEAERERLAARRADAMRAVLADLERQEAYDEARAVAGALLVEDPLDEAAHRAVMRLEHARGNTEVALAQFERLRVRLRDELGVEPMPETLAELARIEGGGGKPADRALVLDRGDQVPGRVARVLGRSDTLRRATAALASSGNVLLHGAGGMGKTTLAAELTAGHVERGGRAAWVWAAAADPDTLFDALAAALDARAEVARARAPSAALRHALATEKIDLVVVDDAANGYTLARLAEALPEGAKLVVTSRRRYPGFERVWIERLERRDARELLDVHAERPVPTAAADALCALLGDHPFAIRIAGVALASGNTSVEGLIGRVVEAPHALTLPSDLAEPGRDSVAALLEVGLSDLPDDAHEALMGLGALAVPAATPELLAELARRDVDAVEDALNALQTRALTERLVEPGSDVVRYRLHELTFSLARVNTHVRPSTVRRAYLRLLERHGAAHDLVDGELPQLVGAIRETLEEGAVDDAVAAMVRLCGPDGYFNGRGHTPASLALLERVAEAAEGLDQSAAHTLQVKLGNARHELLGDLAGARESYRRAAELAHAVGDVAREAIARSALGCVEVSAGGAEGGSMVAEALTLARASGNDLALAQALQNLSFVAGSKGRHEEAAALSAEAIDVADRLGPEVDPQEADHKRFFSRFNLGVARWRGGDDGGGREALLDALAVARQRGNPAWEAYALHEMADLEAAQGDAEAAFDHARAALALYDRHRMRADAQALRAWLAEHGAPEQRPGG